MTSYHLETIKFYQDQQIRMMREFVNNLEKVTEPFFTTKTLTSGLGLGLSTSRRLVEEMGGTLKIFSEKGSGTTVSLVLPVNSMSA